MKVLLSLFTYAPPKMESVAVGSDFTKRNRRCLREQIREGTRSASSSRTDEIALERRATPARMPESKRAQILRMVAKSSGRALGGEICGFTRSNAMPRVIRIETGLATEFEELGWHRLAPGGEADIEVWLHASC